jgi:RNA polymerase sigma-70 factor (ECF subfamily)
MTDPTAEFAELVEKARAGDGAAVARLAEQYEPKIRIVARVLLGPPLRPYLDSIDVVQSVHRSLIAGLRGGKIDLSTPDNLVALAATMLRRKIARQWRHLQRQHRLSHPDGPVLGGDPLAGRAEPDLGPAREAEFRDAARKLYAHLGETEQRIIDLRLEGHSTGEVAARLGLNPIALRVRMTRLRKRLEETGVLADWL